MQRAAACYNLANLINYLFLSVILGIADYLWVDDAVNMFQWMTAFVVAIILTAIFELADLPKRYLQNKGMSRPDIRAGKAAFKAHSRGFRKPALFTIFFMMLPLIWLQRKSVEYAVAHYPHSFWPQLAEENNLLVYVAPMFVIIGLGNYLSTAYELKRHNAVVE